MHERPLLPDEVPPDKSTFSKADSMKMVTHKFARKLSSGDTPKGLCIPFAREELKMKEVPPGMEEPGDIVEVLADLKRILRPTKRRRCILWPKYLNDRKLPIDYIDLPSPDHQNGALRPDAHYRAFDFVASFFQFRLAESVQPYFCFRDSDGDLYCYTVLPMGFYAATEVLQSVSMSLAYIASLDSKSWYSIYVDNLRFASLDADDVDATSERFLALCADYGLWLNEETSNLLHTEQDFCGQHYRCDGKNSFVRLPQSQLVKLESSVKMLLYNHHLTPQEALECFARLFWCSRVLRIDLAFAYPAIKYTRFVSRALATNKLQMKSRITLWPSVVPVLRFWKSQLALNEESMLVASEDTPQFVLCTDASKSGYGGVLVDRVSARVWTVGGSWLPHESARSINELEMLAVAVSLKVFEKIISGKQVHLFVDNEATRAALNKGRSRSFMFNHKIVHTLPFVRKYVPIISRITSEDNPSDEPSRLADTNIEKVARWLSDLSPMARPNCVAFDIGRVVEKNLSASSIPLRDQPERPMTIGQVHCSQPTSVFVTNPTRVSFLSRADLLHDISSSPQMQEYSS